MLNSNTIPISRQKQPSRGVLRKRCFENVNQIYRRKPMPKCDFCIFSEHLFVRTPLNGCFCHSRHILSVKVYSLLRTARPSYQLSWMVWYRSEEYSIVPSSSPCVFFVVVRDGNVIIREYILLSNFRSTK